MLKILIAISILCVFHSASAQQSEIANGTVRQLADGSSQAWSNQDESWVDLETFWLRYAEGRGGLTWGRRTEYPSYDQVGEFDTMIIELESGPCLMEFFHTRWRRANDVRRWDPAFNDYAGCATVFD